MVYIIGDSHTQSFGGDFKTIWLEAPTAYQNIKKVDQIDVKLKDFNISKENDYLFFSFGEIDVRCHLGFISDINKTAKEDVIMECLNRYASFLDYYIDKGYKIGVYGVIPSGPYNGMQGNGRPSYKTYIERNQMTNMFNTKLKEICEQKNILFKSLFNEIITKDNYFDHFSDDGIHLNGGLFKTKNNGVNCEVLLKKLFEDLL